MDKQTRVNLEKSAVFVCILPAEPIEGTEGEEMLLYAIERDKKILLFRPLGHELTPVPTALVSDGGLQKYPFEYVYGTTKMAAERVKRMHGAEPGDSMDIHLHGF